jgi:hypothetical protein
MKSKIPTLTKILLGAILLLWVLLAFACTPTVHTPEPQTQRIEIEAYNYARLVYEGSATLKKADGVTTITSADGQLEMRFNTNGSTGYFTESTYKHYSTRHWLDPTRNGCGCDEWLDSEGNTNRIGFLQGNYFEFNAMDNLGKQQVYIHGNIKTNIPN